MKINHIYPIYTDEKSRQEAVRKELKKLFTVMAAKKNDKAVVV